VVQEESSELTALMIAIDREPCQQRHRNIPRRTMPTNLACSIVATDHSAAERMKANDAMVGVDNDERS